MERRARFFTVGVLLSNPEGLCWGIAFMSRGFSFVLFAFLAHCCVSQASSSSRSHSSSGQSVRLIDASGVSSNAGLLQVRIGDPDAMEFGSVCGMNLARSILFVTRSVAILATLRCVRLRPMSFARNWDMILVSSAHRRVKCTVAPMFVGLLGVLLQWQV